MPRHYTTKCCDWCGSLYSASRCDARYCSSSCRNKHNRYIKLLKADVQNTLFNVLDMTVASYANALKQLTADEIMKAAQGIMSETPEQREARTKSHLFALVKGKENAV
ncbi:MULTISPECIES: hypothetical protein [unclassified Pseudomonas]|uniref:hypothetical protein n=1 Tax=unclassified Pseudomonas TaxID=196821 RepID=UPI0039B74030